MRMMLGSEGGFGRAGFDNGRWDDENGNDENDLSTLKEALSMRMIKGNSGNEDDENDVEQWRRRASFIDENDFNDWDENDVEQSEGGVPIARGPDDGSAWKAPTAPPVLHSCSPLTSAPQKIHLLEILHGALNWPKLTFTF